MKVIFFYRYIYNAYKTMLKKWRNKKVLYMWYRILNQSIIFLSFFPLPSILLLFHMKHSFNPFHSISLLSSFCIPHISSFHLSPFFPFTHSVSFHHFPFHPISHISNQDPIPFPFPLVIPSPHFHTLRSFPLAIISQVILRHNSYHYITYPYHLT